MLNTNDVEELLPPQSEQNRLQMKEQLMMQEQEGRN